MYMDQEHLKENELLKEMKTEKNSDGYYELLFSNFSDWKELERELSTEDEKTFKILKSLYKEYGEEELKKVLRKLAENSVVNRAIAGNMTAEWFDAAVFVVENKDLKDFTDEIEKNPQAKDLKILYLYKIFMGKFSQKERFYPSCKTIEFLRDEYLKYSEKESEYIMNLIELNYDILPDYVDEEILKGIMESF